MKSFQTMVNKATEWIGVVFSCVILFFCLVQLILLIGKI
jgi:hypothetical protein